MTKRVTVIWTKEREFIAVDRDDGGRVGITGPNPEGKSMGASHLLLAALGGCMGTTIIAVMLKRRKEVKSFEVDVVGEHIEEWPKTFTSVHLTYTIKGVGIDEATMERAVWLAEKRYCTVSSTLGLPLTHEIVILEADDSNA
ncbi:MAG: OsmC family protein [Chloroflexi bacterium]|nr:OsmC family protein [Chloroflexota bacterium]